ncbi:hypothetical protein PAXRUDRAFT_777988 [Paxillus rubicundulus Ve08.2h10]|uniref:Uncharacterized protein n=1 Tax=Paxillus rubicundulus Ve08.2h10 TaxID=930991 RepID=A0A0D0DX19_9AGAM|nr:hypothetical protein PAXRUDRAFT_777988 [Paxillus rubicundulus Ve08.2h10]
MSPESCTTIFLLTNLHCARYVVRLALLADGMGNTITYFDSVVFLAMFLLCGCYLKAYSKAQTADAIMALGSAHPMEALLVTPHTTSNVSLSEHNEIIDVDLEKGDTIANDGNLNAGPGLKVKKVSVDLLKVGDIVHVLNGAMLL